MNKPRYSVRTVKQAIELSGGLLAGAAIRLGCSRSTINGYLVRNPKLRETVASCRDVELDRAEHKLFLAVERGESWAITLMLKTLGRTRGYVERQEISTEGGSLIVEVVRHADGREKPQTPGP